MPVIASIVPTPGLLLLQVPVPPDVKFTDVYRHAVDGPAIFVGGNATVTVRVTEQPLEEIYLMSEVPENTPITMPVLEPTVATDVLELLHVPGVDASDKIIVCHTQTPAGPVIGAGGPTVKTIDEEQPVEIV